MGLIGAGAGAAGVGSAPKMSIPGVGGAGAGLEVVGAGANMSTVVGAKGAAPAKSVDGAGAGVSKRPARRSMSEEPGFESVVVVAAVVPPLVVGTASPPKISNKSPPALGALPLVAAAALRAGAAAAEPSAPSGKSPVDMRFCNTFASTTGIRARASLAAAITALLTAPLSLSGTTADVSPNKSISVGSLATSGFLIGGSFIPLDAETKALYSQARNCNSSDFDEDCVCNNVSSLVRAAASPFPSNRLLNLA
mmetsp:Transcript_28009/g.65120  ORF Transcript_28009/g.65120 Transcript_28009/m.65120 type:complete len:252 (-) Transcript_28009:1768-2523(-)